MANAFINEFHYDNAGTDTGEAIELAGLAGTDLTGWQIVLYNGANGLEYSRRSLAGLTISDQENGFGTITVTYPSNGIQNGAPDGIALVDDTGAVVQFLSYEGVFTALDGPAVGLESVDIGVRELDSTPVGSSLQLQGTGRTSTDFTWAPAADDSFGEVNVSQIFQGNDDTGITITRTDSSTAVSEAGQTDTYPIALKTTPSNPVIITINADTQTEISVDGTTFTRSLEVRLGNTTPQTVTVKAINDTDAETSPHTGTISHITASADANYNGLAIPNLTVNITDNDIAVTKIHQIQGNASTQQAGGAHNDVSPLTGQNVTLEGVVVADFQLTNQLRGFFIQEETADQDGDATTSEGIFVFTGNNAPLDVQEGQVVRVTGNVSEFFGMTQVSATTADSIKLVDGDNNIGQVTTASLDLPATGNIDDYYEQSEGMRVEFADTLYVSEYFELARYGQIVLTEGDRPFQYSHIDDTPTAAEYTEFLDNLERSRIILDDDDNIQNSPLPNGAIYYPQPDGLSIGTQGTDFFRGGDTINNLTGVLHWSFAGQAGTDAWRIRPTEADPVEFTVNNPRPETSPDVGGNIKVANFNVLNYFTSIDTTGGNGSPRGADSAAEFERQNAKLTAALAEIDADVFGLVEIENNSTAVQELVNRLNAVVGEGTYDYIDMGVVGTDQITVAVIYKPAVVQPRGEEAILLDSEFTDPNNAGIQRNRPAIAQAFEVIDSNNADFGSVFNVVVNHLKSKGGGDATGADVDQNDGQGQFNDTRTKAADYLVNTWLPTDPTGQGDTDYLIIGDLNAYKGETPITTIKNAGYTDLVEKFGGDDAYSYVFDGQLGYLDHALASESMESQVTGTAEWHINADEIPVFDYNDTIDDGAGEASFEAEPSGNDLYEPNAFRTSDHDPVVIGLDLAPEFNVINGTSQRDDLTGTDRNDRITGFNGNDVITTGGGRDRIVYTNIGDRGDTITDFEVGQDKLVLTELLDSLIAGGYNGEDAIADGYVEVLQQGNSGRFSIQIDEDGSTRNRPFVPFINVQANNLSLESLNVASNFVF
ncbi:ExeM/NucH family extracellular endonuclease [Leptolyngbya sp. FACHB-671]|uniref:ExeM/NucH family extracellular endonuclease n=1 Tax=Leptolyngbya sp. FACHB-671 TaxID=2692812 RepID=UPI0016895F8E|nr:ExeM/NucH family extracellular endonuclease [Leptolyngbya sp. FACHB-671]MBD2070191.1 ExeM/NucH family extracellular endonuclease [Leptolyngbya sp. FACHB-671]